MSCGVGWKQLAKSCYYFSTYRTTWFKARSACLKRGGNLAVPRNNEENNAIWRDAQRRGLSYPFIGLLRHQDKKFYTIKGVKPSYTNWGTKEPNGPNSEHCEHFLSSSAKWNDISCTNRYHFVCQKSLIKRK